MTLTVKVSITEAWGEEGKSWLAEVKDFGLTANARTFEKALDAIQPKIEEYLQRMFGTQKRVIASMGAASGKVEFEIDVQKDRSLNDFTNLAVDVATRPDGDKIVETAGMIMDISQKTGIPPLEVLKTAKAKLDSKKKKGET